MDPLIVQPRGLDTQTVEVLVPELFGGWHRFFVTVFLHCGRLAYMCTCGENDYRKGDCRHVQLAKLYGY